MLGDGAADELDATAAKAAAAATAGGGWASAENAIFTWNTAAA